MIPASFDYVRAESVEHAIALLGEYGDDAKLLAGGHSLLPLMKLRLATPAVLVDIGRVPDGAYVRDEGDHLAVGALTTHHHLEHDPTAKEQCGVLAHTAHLVGDPQVRHCGTIGGSCAHGDPASDLPATLLALDATFVLTGPSGPRSVAAAEFFRGFWETALAPDELLTEIQVPKTGPAGFSFQKFTRRAQDWAVVAAVAVRNGSTRVALANMGATPLRATTVEQALAGGAAPAEAAEHAADGTAAPSDLSASADYREHLARTLCRRALDGAGIGA